MYVKKALNNFYWLNKKYYKIFMSVFVKVLGWTTLILAIFLIFNLINPSTQ